jgi:hypothetical protein
MSGRPIDRASGRWLDALAETFAGLRRMPGETDEELRYRLLGWRTLVIAEEEGE